MSTSKQQFAAIAFTFEAGMGIVAVLVGRGIGFDPLRAVRWDQPWAAWAASGGWGVAAALPLVLGLVVLDRQPHLLTEFKARVSEAVLPLFRGLSLWEIGAISAAAGFGEEMVFRGLLQGGLESWLDTPHGWIVALAVASVAFGVCHWLNATYAVLATGVGFYLGGLYIFTGGLVAPMLTHGLYDFVAILYLTRHSRSLGASP